MNLLKVNTSGPVSPAAALAFEHPPGLNDTSLLRYQGRWVTGTGRYPPPSGHMGNLLEVRYAGTLELPQIDYEAYQYCDKGRIGYVDPLQTVQGDGAGVWGCVPVRWRGGSLAQKETHSLLPRAFDAAL
jgi:hypothetical protein